MECMKNNQENRVVKEKWEEGGQGEKAVGIGQRQTQYKLVGYFTDYYYSVRYRNTLENSEQRNDMILLIIKKKLSFLF